MHSTGKMRKGVIGGNHSSSWVLIKKIPKNVSRAHADGVADLLGVEVVVHQAVNDGRQLGLHQGVALLLDARPEKAAQGVAQLLEELHDLVLCGFAGDEVVQVGDDVDADGTGELVPALGDGD